MPSSSSPLPPMNAAHDRAATTRCDAATVIFLSLPLSFSRRSTAVKGQAQVGCQWKRKGSCQSMRKFDVTLSCQHFAYSQLLATTIVTSGKPRRFWTAFITSPTWAFVSIINSTSLSG